MRVCWMGPSQLHICSGHLHIHLSLVHYVHLLYPYPNWQTISRVSLNRHPEHCGIPDLLDHRSGTRLNRSEHWTDLRVEAPPVILARLLEVGVIISPDVYLSPLPPGYTMRRRQSYFTLYPFVRPRSETL